MNLTEHALRVLCSVTSKVDKWERKSGQGVPFCLTSDDGNISPYPKFLLRPAGPLGLGSTPALEQRYGLSVPQMRDQIGSAESGVFPFARIK